MIVVDIKDKGFKTFETYVGLDQSEMRHNKAFVKSFDFYVDGELKASTGVVERNTPMQKVVIDVEGASELKMVSVPDRQDENENYQYSDAPAVWADAKFIR